MVTRDGVRVSPRLLAEFELFPEAAAAVEALRRNGWLVFVISNQPDIARGLLSPETLDAMSDLLRSRLNPDDMAVCPHDDPDGCACRKPKPGMLLAFRDRWDLDLPGSFVIGDTWRDIEAGRRAQCRTILLERESDESPGVEADHRARTLAEALPLIGSCESRP
mgnify:CR=1 FL=1